MRDLLSINSSTDRRRCSSCSDSEWDSEDEECSTSGYGSSCTYTCGARYISRAGLKRRPTRCSGCSNGTSDSGCSRDDGCTAISSTRSSEATSCCDLASITSSTNSTTDLAPCSHPSTIDLSTPGPSTPCSSDSDSEIYDDCASEEFEDCASVFEEDFLDCLEEPSSAAVGGAGAGAAGEADDELFEHSATAIYGAAAVGIPGGWVLDLDC
jgi:hypothetical protein